MGGLTRIALDQESDKDQEEGPLEKIQVDPPAGATRDEGAAYHILKVPPQTCTEEKEAEEEEGGQLYLSVVTAVRKPP